MKYLVFTLYTLLIVFVSVLAYLDIIPTKQISIPYYDYIGHFILYGIWAYLFAQVLNVSAIRIKSFFIPWGIILITIITIIEEWLQSFSAVRSSNWGDLICGILGIAIANVIFNQPKIRKTT